MRRHLSRDRNFPLPRIKGTGTNEAAQMHRHDDDHFDGDFHNDIKTILTRRGLLIGAGAISVNGGRSLGTGRAGASGADAAQSRSSGHGR